jgi:hypothetical protein
MTAGARVFFPKLISFFREAPRVFAGLMPGLARSLVNFCPHVGKGWLVARPRNPHNEATKIDFQSLRNVVRQSGILFPNGDFRRVPFKAAPRRTGIITRFRGACKFEMPIGYQDKTGFHTGEMTWPE